MSIIVNNIRLSIEQVEEKAIEMALNALKLPQNKIRNVYIYRASVDARREKPFFVYSVGVDLFEGEEAFVKGKNCSDIVYKSSYELTILRGKEKLNNRPVIVGFGPAGMFAGLVLSSYGYNPIILERGSDVDTRAQAVDDFWDKGILNTETNVQYGEGGAGTFSDGKLTTRINDYRCDYIINEFVRFGATKDIKYKAKPHIGTDMLRQIVKNIRLEIIKNGGTVLFDTKLTDIQLKNNKLHSITVNEKDEIKADALILATGHSARDTFLMLLQKELDISPKGFSVGVRIEHKQKEIDKALYGDYAEHKRLKAAEYQLSFREGDAGVYTFCMCPGGTVVAAASEENTIVTNGMSYYNRAGENANSALVASVLPQDFGNNALKAIEFQRELEKMAFLKAGANYSAPVQRVEDFLNGNISKAFGEITPTYTGKTAFCDINELLPANIKASLHKGIGEFEKKLKGFAHKDAILTGLETRTSSPIRVNRDEAFMALGIEGLYPCGEGAGYAGGIISAAVDGIKIAEHIIERFKA